MGFMFPEPGKDQNYHHGSQKTEFYRIATFGFDRSIKTFIFPNLLDEWQFHHKTQSLLLKKLIESKMV